MSVEEGKRLRDQGMAAVEAYSKKNQKLHAKYAIYEVAMSHSPSEYWTTDEVHTVLEQMQVQLDNSRLLGPLMKQAQRAGIIEPVVCHACNRQETRLSKRKKRHSGPQYVWKTTQKEWESAHARIRG